MRVCAGKPVYVITEFVNSTALTTISVRKRIVSEPVKDMPNKWWVKNVSGYCSGSALEEEMFETKEAAIQYGIEKILRGDTK